MINETITYRCPRCQSEHLEKNGHSKSGKQKYHCKDCDAYGTLNPTVAYPAERRAEILKAYQESSSLRGIERTFGVARQTVAKWLRQEDEQQPALPPLETAQAGDVLELDELWSFVGSKKTNAGSG
jgi:transposase-like protein